MNESNPNSCDVKHEQQHWIARGCVYKYNQVLRLLITIQDPDRVLSHSEALLIKAFSVLENYLYENHFGHPLDLLKTAIKRGIIAVTAQINSETFPVTVALSDKSFAVMGSTTSFDAFLWNQNNSTAIKVHKWLPSDFYGLAVKASESQSLVAVLPSHEPNNLPEETNEDVNLVLSELSPAEFLQEFATQRAIQQSGQGQFLIGFPRFSFHEEFTTAAISRNSEENNSNPNSDVCITSLELKLDGLYKTLQSLEQKIVDPRPIDSLIERLQFYENETIKTTIMNPMINEWILLYDLLPKSGSLEDVPFVQAFRQSVENSLSFRDITPYQASGEQFDPAVQKCVGHEETFDPERENTIAKRVRIGFRSAEKIHRHEEVFVFRFKAPSSIKETGI
ncbi:MAG: hypothetical protein COA78_07785 [Blastopirellula sp.]|nr:MAG: hypothetical protein COA78_07785 [Blastopirellula sp.]